MKVLLLYPYLPHPQVSHGSGRLLVPLLRLWKREAEVTLVCGYRPHEAQHVEAARALVHEIHPVLRPLRSDLSPIGRLGETARTAVRQLTRREPVHVTKLDRGGFHRAIAAARARTRFDVAQVELAGMGGYVRRLEGLPSVLVDHEAELAPGGHGGFNWHASHYVRSVYPRFTRVVALCREDAADLEGALPGISVGVRRPGVAVPDAAPARPRAARPTVLFSGSPHHFPNQEALAWLSQEVWPRVRAGSSGARCVAIGGSPAPKLGRLLQAAGIEDGGFVPDLDAELAAAAVVVAPVRSGGGVRIKCLDALAAGRPLVTTRLGARGLDLRHGEHALIADGAEDFADAVLTLLGDPALASRMGEAGREHVRRVFRHEAAAAFNSDLWKILVSA